MNLRNIIISFSISAVVALSCKPTTDEPTKTSVDQTQLLVNYADNYIVPSYVNFNTKLKAVETLLNNYTTQDHDQLKTKVNEAYLAWQPCAFYDFGPALTQSLQNNINIYPVDTAEVNSNVSAELQDVTPSTYATQKGLPTLDYLSNTRQNLSEQEISYLQIVVSDMIDRIESVEEGWTGSGAYRDFFVENVGTDNGSSLSTLLNAYIQYFEKDLRDDKLGIPLGIRSLNSQLPEKSEAYYSEISNLLLQESVLSMKNLFYGGDLESIDDLLLNGNSTDELSTTIAGLWDEVELSVNNINTPIEDYVITNQDTGKEAYADIQELLVVLKIDLMSSLDVKINYVDTDGD